MSSLMDTRRPSPSRTGRDSNDPSISLDTLNGLEAASSGFANHPQELLGLSAGPAPMLITSSSTGTRNDSSGSSGRPTDTVGHQVDYNFPQDLDLPNPQGSQQIWKDYQVAGYKDEGLVESLQGHTSSRPESVPWSGIHLNGVPLSQPPKSQAQHSSSNPRNISIAQQRSTAGSNANQTDEGYYTYSQPDACSMYSGDSSQMYHPRPGQRSIPRTMPAAPQQLELDQYSTDPFPKDTAYQPAQLSDRQDSNPFPQNPIHCAEIECSFTCKTMSDLKKHIARHRRAHVCDWPQCARAEKGFATINDLERHQKAVHGIEPSHGRSRMYKCFAMACKHREREWPRFDNFKQHLIKMHKAESTDELIQRSNQWYDTEKRTRQSAPVSAVEIPTRDIPLSTRSSNQLREESSPRPRSENLLSPTWQRTARTASTRQATTPTRHRHSSISSQPQPSARLSPSVVPLSGPFQSPDTGSTGSHHLHQISSSTKTTQPSSGFLLDSPFKMSSGRPTSARTVPNPDISTLSDLPDITYPSYSEVFPADQNDLAQIASNFASEQQLSLPVSDQDLHYPSTLTNAGRPSSTPLPYFFDDLRAFLDSNVGGQRNEHTAIVEQIWKAGIEKLNETQHRPVTTTATSSAPSVITPNLTSNAGSTENRPAHRCPTCAKTYPRRCDMTKHMKRHDRPYGCTFSKCYEKFGSKYDWKRHENSQHFQQQCWICRLCASGLSKSSQGATTSSTVQLFYDRDQYKVHMRSVHSASRDTVRNNVDKNWVGRNCESRFWCGFCQDIIILQNRGPEGADERFNHIDKHFQENQDISQWLDIVEWVVKGQPQELEPDKEEQDEADVDSLLSLDCIGDPVMESRGEHDDAEVQEDESRNVDVDAYAGGGSSQQISTGQKRAPPSDFDLSSSASDIRPPQRRRRDAAQFIYCHKCLNGPWIWRQSESCVMCSHRFCRSCTYESE